MWAVSFWCSIFHLCVRGLRSLAGFLVLHLWRCCVTEAENHHANPVIWPQFRESGPQLSTYLPFMDICFTSCATGQVLPCSAALPANILCIWTAPPTVTNRWPLDLESSQSHYQSDLSSAGPPWFVPDGSRQCLLRLLSHPRASWHTVFARVKWLALPLESPDWLWHCGVWRVKWHTRLPQQMCLAVWNKLAFNTVCLHTKKP